MFSEQLLLAQSVQFGGKMKREDDQPLWDFLGRVPEARVSPFFARNTLRQVRQQRRSIGRFALLWNWRMATSAVAATVAGLAAFFLMHSAPPLPTPKSKSIDVAQVSQPASQPQLKADATTTGPQAITRADEARNDARLADIDAQDYEVVANLDDLMALYETSLWDENSSL